MTLQLSLVMRGLSRPGVAAFEIDCESRYAQILRLEMRDRVGQIEMRDLAGRENARQGIVLATVDGDCLDVATPTTCLEWLYD